MDTELDFPTIDADAAQVATTAIANASRGEISADLTKIDLDAVADAYFTKARADVATAKEKLANVVHDLPTQAKVDDAVALRNRLIKTPLAEVRKVAKALKSKLDQTSKGVGAKLDTLVASFDEADALITPQIEAAQAKIDEEKRIAAEKEEARKQAHREALAKLAAPAERAALPEMTAERIANGIAAVEKIVIDRAAWEEFADRAEEQKAVTLERMRALHTKAVAAEAEAARLEAERAEAARVAEAQRIEAERLAAERAELERERAAIQAEKDRLAAEAQAKAEEAARLEREQREAAARQQAEADRQARELEEAEKRANRPALIEQAREIVNDIIAAEVLGDAIAASPVNEPSTYAEAARYYRSNGLITERPAEVPMLKLGELWDALGLTDREAFLASVGFTATPAPKGTGKLYRHSDMAAICLAISKRFADLAKAQPAT